MPQAISSRAKWIISFFAFFTVCGGSSHAVTHYVAPGGTHQPPFTNWYTAATSIQAAVEAAMAGDLILVSNGVYVESDTAYLMPYYASAIVVTNAVTVSSVNGPLVTIIDAQYQVRCAYLGSNAVLQGFTLRHGLTIWDPLGGGAGVHGVPGAIVKDCRIVDCLSWDTGGGAHSVKLIGCVIEDNMAVDAGAAVNAQLFDCTVVSNLAFDGSGGVLECYLSNCVVRANECCSWDGGGIAYSTAVACRIEANRASMYGGGAYCSWLHNCVLVGNEADTGGGASWCSLFDCDLRHNLATVNGGGAAGSTLIRCMVVSNRAQYSGGGMYEGGALNCLIAGNEARDFGGGVFYGSLGHCTIVENVAGSEAGAAAAVPVNNCIIYYNHARSGCDNYRGPANHCCLVPDPGGSGNVTAPPHFRNREAFDFHLALGSPCIDAGDNPATTATDDLDRVSRPLDGDGDGTATVDIGCYEFAAKAFDTDGDGLSDGYEVYGTATDPARNDSDGDGCRDGEELLVAGTDPLDPESVLRVERVEHRIDSGPEGGVVIRWKSRGGRWYTVYRMTNLVEGKWEVFKTGIEGREGTTCITDHTARAWGTVFYRVGVSRTK